MAEECQIPLGLAKKKSRAELRQQANLGTKIQQIIDKAGVPDQPQREVEMDEMDRRTICGDDQAEDDGHHHGYSAHARDRHVVNLQVAGLVVNLEIEGGAPNERQQRCACSEGQKCREITVRCEEPCHLSCQLLVAKLFGGGACRTHRSWLRRFCDAQTAMRSMYRFQNALVGSRKSVPGTIVFSVAAAVRAPAPRFDAPTPAPH